MIYLNEFDPFAADWLGMLSTLGHIPISYIDSRTICDVTPQCVDGFTQCHFFAGIGGWPLAFQLAGLPESVNAWSGSCPCQPYSTAGKGKGQADPRHLWPVWFPLIRECKPEYVFGEQVSAAIGHGWLDGVFAGMEGAGYTGGAVVLGAHSVRAPHIRQRVFWGFRRNDGLPDSQDDGASENIRQGRRESDSVRGGSWLLDTNVNGCNSGFASSQADRYRDSADATGSGLRNATGDDEQRTRQLGAIIGIEAGGSGCGLQHAESDGRNARGGEPIGGSIASGCCGLRDSIDSGLQGHSGNGNNGDQSGRIGTDSQRSIAASDPWSDYTIGHYRDGKARRIGRGIFPLAYGVPRSMGQGQSGLRRILRSASGNRKGRLKGYGNAIVPQLAAVFIRAFMEAME